MVLGFPTSSSISASYIARPLICHTNFLPHQRKWGETAGAATASRAMVSPSAPEYRHLCPQPPTPRVARFRSTHSRLTSPRPQGQVILGAQPAAPSSLTLSPHQQDKEYVGFAALPNQLHRKSVKKGFDFTLMVAGPMGFGQGTGWGRLPPDTLAVSSPDQVGLSCLQGSQAWENPPSSTACFSPISMRTGNCQKPVVRPS